MKKNAARLCPTILGRPHIGYDGAVRGHVRMPCEGLSWTRIENVLLPVLMASWQIECCGEPFALDQVVRWQLLFSEAGRWRSEPPEHEVTLTGQAEPFGWELGEQDRTGVRLRVGSAVLYWSAPEVVAGAVTVTGTVQEDHHAGVPEDFPATTGRVRRIRGESLDFREDPP